MSAKLRAYLVLGLVFLFGAATGGGAMYANARRERSHLYEGSRGRAHLERRLAALTQELTLSSEQSTQAAAILERQREQRVKVMHETMERCGDPLRKLRAASDAELQAILTPAQQKRFEALLQARSKP
jgi:Spy/CpxP family protein refolding chaperone